MTRQVLLHVAGITSKRTDRANASLLRILESLVAEQVIASYAPSPLPLAMMEMVTLRWAAEGP